LYRIIEDGCYQAIIRHKVTAEELPKFQLEYDDISPASNEIEMIVKNALQKFYESLKISKKNPVKIKKLYLPWKRMFEIGMEIELAE
jgi:hypothetical protein